MRMCWTASSGLATGPFIGRTRNIGNDYLPYRLLRDCYYFSQSPAIMAGPEFKDLRKGHALLKKRKTRAL